MAYIGTLATATESVSTGATTLTVPRGVPAGRTLAIGCVWDSAAAALPALGSVTDSRGNTYALDAGVNSGTTVSCALLRGRVVNGLDQGDTITIVLDTGVVRARWAVVCEEHDAIAANPFDKSSVNAAGPATSLATGQTDPTSEPHELVIAVFGFGQDRAVTPPQGWQAAPLVQSNAGSSDRAVQMIHRYVSSAGPQEGTLGIDPAGVYAAAIGTYRLDEQTPGPSVGEWGHVPAGAAS